MSSEESTGAGTRGDSGDGARVEAAAEMVSIPLALAQATLNYLGRCPYVEVRPLLRGWEDAGVLAADSNA